MMNYSSSPLARDWYAKRNRPAIEQHANKLIKQANKLGKPARALLLKLKLLFEGNEFKPVTRADVAAMLQHKRFHTYDIQLMNELIHAGLIQTGHDALPLKNKLPRGWRYLYRMTPDTAWILDAARRNRG